MARSSADSIRLSPKPARRVDRNHAPAEDHLATSSAQKLRIEYWPIGRLIDYPRNPRKNDAAVDQMVASIQEFGSSALRSRCWPGHRAK